MGGSSPPLSLKGNIMHELLSFSTHKRDLILWERGELRPLLHFFDLAGIELLPVGEVPKELGKQVVGVHLPFQPVWLPFWFEDHEYLQNVFPGEANLARFYGGSKPEDFVKRVAGWLTQALGLHPRYIVIHVSHCGLEEVFSLKFRYGQKVVFEATAALLNAAWAEVPEELKKEPYPTFVFENLWWPGLRLLSPEEVESFWSLLSWPGHCLGLALDTGHLLNASYLLVRRDLRGPVSATQALVFLEDIVKKWPRELCQHIKTVHLNFSPKAYLFEPDENGLKRIREEKDPLLRYALARQRVQQLDPHLPFEGVDLRPLLDLLEPRYVVHELRFQELGDLISNLSIQKRCLKA